MLRNKTTRSRTKRYDARTRPPGENALLANGVSQLSEEELDRRAWAMANQMPADQGPARAGARKPK